jgi:class 3 adenylate cyclase/tetratricopeptide (TPR) repeat protein
MRCPRCGQDNPPGSRFCNACGAALEVACPACGHRNSIGSRFCNECGAPGVAPAGTFGTPDAYTPGHLAGRIRTSQAELEGERKQITILFADLKASMELLANRDPEEARRILDPLLERMIDAVHHYEGTVNQVLGDGIMALFGAPLAHEDHAVRACYAALRMQESVAGYAAEVRRVHGTPLEIRVGLNSGEVVVRSIGNDLTMDYSAVGQSTHIAARMEQLARPGTILITAATARLAEGWVDVTPMPEVRVKGLAEPVAVYELTGASAARSRLHATAARGLTRFVGRDAEMAQLVQVLARAASGRGQVAAVAGEPGVGKSRLVWEFLRGPRVERWRVLEAASVSYGRGMAYYPVIALLKEVLGLGDAADAALAGERLRALLGAQAPADVVTPLLALLDAPVADDRWHALEPAQRRERTIAAVKHLALALSERQPTCIVIEDLQWIDAETQAVLDALVDAAPAARLLLLVTYRPEYQHGWSGRMYYAQVRIDPLARPDTTRLLDVMLGPDPGLARLKGLLVERTDGNPFFIEESVRNLVETRALAGEPGAYRLSGRARPVDVPVTVQSVLAARIDRLAAEDKHVLQAAAAIGKDVPLDLLREIDGPPDVLDQALARLRGAEFLYEVRLFPEIAYTFSHALTLDVALGGLLRDQRRQLDAAIVSAIERAAPERRAEQLDRLAHHALRGEVWDKALVYCRDAGERAAARSAHRAAVRYFEQALEALAHLPAGAAASEAAIDIRLALRYSLSPLGEFSRMIEELRAAERLAESLGDELRLGRVSSFLANYHTVMLDFPQAIRYGRRALEIAERHRDLPLGTVASTFLALAHQTLAEYPAAIELARRNVAVLRGGREYERYGMAALPSVYSRVVLAWSLAETGDFEDAVAAGAEATVIAEKADHPYSLIFSYLGLGTALNRRGEFTAALTPLERARTLSLATEAPGIFGLVAAATASAYAHTGRAADAIALLEEAIGRAIAHRDPYGHWLRTGGLAEAYLGAGRAPEALPLAERGVEITRFVHARGQEAWALRLHGEALAAQPEPDLARAETVYREALAAALARGMRTLEARCRLEVARVLEAAGRGAEAGEERRSAAGLLTALGMERWRAEATRP